LKGTINERPRTEIHYWGKGGSKKVSLEVTRRPAGAIGNQGDEYSKGPSTRGLELTCPFSMGPSTRGPEPEWPSPHPQPQPKEGDMAQNDQVPLFG
jgi:hypothetical protein